MAVEKELKNCYRIGEHTLTPPEESHTRGTPLFVNVVQPMLDFGLSVVKEAR